jgi:hypothetical protein
MWPESQPVDAPRDVSPPVDFWRPNPFLQKKFIPSLKGTSDDDTIFGYKGHDKLYGYGGNDTLYGGTGIDLLYGGSGQDLFSGGNGNDIVDYNALSDSPGFEENNPKGIYDILLTPMALERVIASISPPRGNQPLSRC